MNPNQTDGLVAYYPFNANSIDESGNGNNGTIYGATLTADRFGNSNSAYSFDGTLKYLTVPKREAWNFGTKDFTIGLWFNGPMQSKPFPPSMISQWNCIHITNCWILGLNPNGSGKLAFYWGGFSPDAPFLTGNRVITDNKWHYITLMRRNGTFEVYIDGLLEISNSTLQDKVMGSNALDIYIGTYECRTYGNVASLIGILDDIRIYNRALSETEIQQLYAATDSTNNQPPLAMFAASAVTGTAPLTVNLDASASNDADGSITSYNWQSSFGHSVNGATASMNFTSPGDYTITLTVTDNKGAKSQAVKNISVSSPLKGYLQVTITPADALTAGAQWCVSGACYSSGVKAELAAGTYTLEFKTITGWTKPANQSVTVTSGQTATAAGSYTDISGNSFVSRTLPCYIAGNTFTVFLNATPAASASGYAVEDTPPSGWTVSDINNGGAYDSLNNKVKYGPFFDGTARTLAYNVTPPSDQTGDKTFSGTASADGLSSTIAGDSVVSVCTNNHPADADRNFAISITEVTAYGSAWKRGTTWAMPPNPIPIDYLTRAGALWKVGEKYKYDVSSGNCPLCWVSSSATVRVIRSDDSTAVCNMPANYTPGQSFTVSIAVTPSSGVMAYAVEDSVPTGWVVSSADNAGFFDAVNNKVKYGPFLDNTERILTYQITPPATASGSYSFTGTASFDGTSNIAITGDRTLSYGTVTEVRGDVNGDGKLDLQDVIYILQTIAGMRQSGIEGDADGDGKVDLKDVIYILRVIVGVKP